MGSAEDALLLAGRRGLALLWPSTTHSPVSMRKRTNSPEQQSAQDTLFSAPAAVTEMPRASPGHAPVIPVAGDPSKCPEDTEASAAKMDGNYLRCEFGSASGTLPDSPIAGAGKCCYHKGQGLFLYPVRSDIWKKLLDSRRQDGLEGTDNAKYVPDGRTSCNGQGETGAAQVQHGQPIKQIFEGAPQYCEYGNHRVLIPFPAFLSRCCWDTQKERFNVHFYPNNVPIVLVHGLHDDSRVWDSTVKYFREENRWNGEIWRFDFSDTTDEDIEVNTRRFFVFLKYTGLLWRNFNLVAHSMGGLLAREAISLSGGHLSPKLLVDHLVTLATPNFGTDLAAWCIFDPLNVFKKCYDSTQELKTNSAFLKSLNSRTSGTYNRSNTMTWGITGDGMVYRIDGTDVTSLPGADNSNVGCHTEEVDGSTPTYPCNDAAFKPQIHTSITRKKQVLNAILKMVS
ncbi:hypothetical protein HIM_08978 [Hirsutella minnesotensis 3608]|uniref:DUF676 domain-containing protein n=1 Tax=Hirsutella minnesotensis 3608 TaxID=1043627 RepID=A0A0F7ZGX8_9HYPO|nr:hypothetical protein HIM_08978 [Hirsutella minnesotensis 3608]